jgi:hypothetical protein
MPTYKVRYAHIRQLHYRPTNRNGAGRGACTARLRRGRRGPARLGTEGRRHTCHARPGRRAPQVHGNCTIGRQRFNEAAGCARLVYGDVRACSRTDGHTSMQPIGHRRVCTTPASTRPYYPKWCWSARGAAAGALAHPCGPRGGLAGWLMESLYLVASVTKCSIHTTSESGPIPPAWPRGDAVVAATFVPIVEARCQRGERQDAQGDD